MPDSKPVERYADSIQDFCTAHGISRGLFYQMEKKGIAPQTIRVGRRRLITRESAEAWRQKMMAV